MDIKKIVGASLITLMVASLTSAENTIYDVKGPGGKNITAYDRTSDRSFGGYFDTEYFTSKDGADFRAHRLILQSSARLTDRIMFNAEIEYEYGAQLNGGNNDNDGQIKIEQAWVDYKFSDALIQRTGIVVVPFGRLNVLHDSDVRDATNRPVYAKKVVPTTWMDTGIGAHGVLDFDETEVTYEAYMLNGLQDSSTVSVSGGIRGARPTLKSDNNRSKAFVSRLGISPFVGLELATSYYTGKLDSGESKADISMLGFDAFYKAGAFELLGEYAQNDLSDVANTIPESMNGYYAEARYHVTGDWLKKSPFGTGFRNPVITLFARYGEVNIDATKAAPTNKGEFKQTTVGFNFRPVETVAYKFEYEMNDESGTDNDKFWASVAIGF